MSGVPVGFGRFKRIMAAADAEDWNVRQCVREDGKAKRGYATRRQAEKDAERIRARASFTPKPGEVLEPYDCKICNLWHIGNHRPERPDSTTG